MGLLCTLKTLVSVTNTEQIIALSKRYMLAILQVEMYLFICSMSCSPEKSSQSKVYITQGDDLYYKQVRKMVVSSAFVLLPPLYNHLLF